MKKAIAALLACLLLCGLVMPAALAATPVEDLIEEWKLLALEPALALNVQVQATGGPDESLVYPFTPAETGWVDIVLQPLPPGQACAVLDGDWNPVGIAPYAFTDVLVKLTGGITYYFVLHNDGNYSAKNIDTTLTIKPAEKPVLRYEVLELTTKSDSTAFWAFTTGWVIGVDYTILSGGTGMGVSYNNNYVYISTGVQAGTHVVQFTDCDGEDLGTLTIIVEEWTFAGWLQEIWGEMQNGWSDGDKTTMEWLSGIGLDLLLVVGSPIIVPLGMLFIFFMGPMGWLLLILPPIMPFYGLFKLPVDIIGLFKSIFN